MGVVGARHSLGEAVVVAGAVGGLWTAAVAAGAACTAGPGLNDVQLRLHADRGYSTGLHQAHLKPTKLLSTTPLIFFGGGII